MLSGLNSPSEVYFFTKNPDEYKLPNWNHSYHISEADENTLENAKTKTRSGARFETIQFAEPTVDVQGKQYSYIIRSFASRENFAKVMSPEYLYQAKGTGIRGLHYAAAEPNGDAIGITIEAETPEAAKEQFQTWHGKIKDALRVLADRFAVLNKELDQKIEELATKRIDEVNRAKKAL